MQTFLQCGLWYTIKCVKYFLSTSETDIKPSRLLKPVQILTLTAKNLYITIISEIAGVLDVS